MVFRFNIDGNANVVCQLDIQDLIMINFNKSERMKIFKVQISHFSIFIMTPWCKV
jgi:hypothetical protein